jgi:hypothetical protein
MAGNLSRYCYFVNSTGAVSRYKLETEPENYHVTGFLLLAAVRVRVQRFAVSVWAAVFCKNRDKQLTFIVRVRWS